MPDRILHAMPFALAPLVAFLGLAWTAASDALASAARHGMALVGQAPAPTTALGEYGGYLLSVGAVIFTLIQGWNQAKLRQEADERRVWTQEIIDLAKKAGALSSEVESLKGQLKDATKLSAKAYNTSQAVKATVDRDIRPTIDAVNQQMGSTSDPTLNVAPPA